MTLTSAIPDDAPPPYTPIDPLTPASSNESATTADAAAEQPLVDNDTLIPSYDSFASVPNFISASPYFRERALTVPRRVEPQEPTLQHTLTIYLRSQSKDYQRFPKCLRPRSVEITQHDWDTFLNYLFPPHLAPAASQSHLPRKLRAEIQRDRKDCPQEGDVERQTRIEAVFTEWNKYFFVPRSTEILYTYVSPSDSPPPTHLCPKCYPSTVRSLPVRSALSGNGPYLVRSETTPSCSAQRSISRRPVGGNPRSSSALAPEVSTVTAQGSTTIPFPTENSNSGGAEGCAYDRKFAPAYGIAGATDVVANWAAQLGERAEQYGQWISDQAAAHGKLVEARNQQYCRMIEDQAKARGEYIEQQANYFGGMGRGRGRGGGRGWGKGGPGAHWAHNWGLFGHMHHHGYRHGSWGHNSGHSHGHAFTHAPAHPWSGWEGHRRNRQVGQRQRSASVSSTSSSSSSSSTSSSSSSDSDASFLSTLSSYSQRHAAGLADFKEKIRSIQWEHEQSQTRARMDVQRSDIAYLHQELRILRTAHKQFRSTKRAKRGAGAHVFSPWGTAHNSSNNPTAGTGVVTDIKSKEAQRALKQDIQSTKKEFRTLVARIRDEKRELRRGRRKRRKEAKRERREGKREERRRNKGKCKTSGGC